MKKQSTILLALLSLILIGYQSCTNDNVKDLNEPVNETQLTDAEQKVLFQMRNKNNKISIEEATNIVNDVIGFLDEGYKTKSGKVRKIETITALRSDFSKKLQTKSSEGTVDIEMPDTLAYIYNFADSAGYTIIVADTRVENPVLCYTGNGTLKDSIDNGGLAVFLTGAEYYIKESIIKAQEMRDSLISTILSKMKETGVKDTAYVDKNKVRMKINAPTTPTYEEITTSYSYGPWAIQSQIGPLLSVEWGQRAPFNTYIPHDCSDNPSGKAPVGCVAVSTSYILTYWFNKRNINFTIDGYNVNSNLICKFTWYPNRYIGAASNDIEFSTTTDADNARFQLAHLMERIGSRVNMSYDCDDGSGADDKDATAYLRDIGFKGGYKTDYNVNTILSSLNNSRPVMIGGYSTKNHILGISWLFWYSGGHSWVIDGYLRRIRPVTVTVTTTMTEDPNDNLPMLTKSVSPDKLLLITTTSTYTYNEYSPYYLHNNWGNYWNNGYFTEGCFNFNIDPTLPSSTKSGEPHNYQFGVDIFPDIYY